MFENICNNCLKKCNQCNRYNKNLESISIINSVLLNEETIIHINNNQLHDNIPCCATQKTHVA